MKKKQLFFAAVLAISLLALSGCERIRETYGRQRNPTEGVAPPASVFAVNTTLAVQGTIQDYLALSGDIIASSTVDTFSDAAGRISRLYVSVGSRVQRGDPVAAVDPSRPGMEFIPSVVRAPVAGTIVALPAQLGMTVSQAVPIARIAGGAGLQVRLHVAERFISRIALNQPCEIRVNAFPGEIFRGTISEISPTLDVASRTMEIRVNVENLGGRLRAGMFATVRIITEQKDNVVKIPVSAMINRFGEQFIYIADSSDVDAPVARRRDLVPGIIIDGVMEVNYGLAPNEEVIIRGQTLLEEGSRINIVGRYAPLGSGAN
jgi:multidrug efflux pump subunit AcrA (membrane-fusion protein)